MNQLHNLEAFQAALTDYELSESAHQTLAAVKLVMLLGPTGGGRSTLIKELVDKHHYYFVISDTTRLPRENDGVLEQNGREYWFRNEDEFLADIKAGSFLEAEVIHEQQVSGVSMRELAKALELGETAITDADVGGLQNTLRLKPETIAVLIIPPSFEEWQQRLNQRGTMAKDELKRRLQTALNVFTVGIEDERFHLVVNDKYQLAADRVQKIVDGVPQPETEKQELRQLCRHLIDETNTYLSTL